MTLTKYRSTFARSRDFSKLVIVEVRLAARFLNLWTLSWVLSGVGGVDGLGVTRTLGDLRETGGVAEA